MIVGAGRESKKDERRVALDPITVGKLVKSGVSVHIEKDAGLEASFTNADYEKAGARLLDAQMLYNTSDVILRIHTPSLEEISHLKNKVMVVGLLDPFHHLEHLQKFAEKKITAFALELLPRISRAQTMDVLSSQASLAGYKAVILAAATLGKYFPMLTTAAGTMPPAKVLVIGAGVAGLQAIATAKRLGAVVEAYDIRPEVKEQIESLGAKAISIEVSEGVSAQSGYAKVVSQSTQEKIQQMLTNHVQKSDVLITTAFVPGKKAPRIVTEAMVDRMNSGSVIVDLATEQGGNVAYAQPGKNVLHQGITLLGPLNLPATMPIHASQMFAKNLLTFLNHVVKSGAPVIDFKDEIMASSCVTHEGVIRLPEEKK